VIKRHLDGYPRVPWATGGARFEPMFSVDSHRLSVAVRCRLGSMVSETRALLDTGAQWTVIGGELADIVETSASNHASGARRKRHQAPDEIIEISTPTRRDNAHRRRRPQPAGTVVGGPRSGLERPPGARICWFP